MDIHVHVYICCHCSQTYYPSAPPPTPSSTFCGQCTPCPSGGAAVPLGSWLIIIIILFYQLGAGISILLPMHDLNAMLAGRLGQMKDEMIKSGSLLRVFWEGRVLRRICRVRDLKHQPTSKITLLSHVFQTDSAMAERKRARHDTTWQRLMDVRIAIIPNFSGSFHFYFPSINQCPSLNHCNHQVSCFLETK
jgi:hypothetical protein